MQNIQKADKENKALSLLLSFVVTDKESNAGDKKRAFTPFFIATSYPDY